MKSLERLIKNINELIKADDEELKEDLNLYPELVFTLLQIKNMEDSTYKLLQEQANHYAKGIVRHTTDTTIEKLLKYVDEKLLKSDKFVEEFGKEFNVFLDATTKKLTEHYLKAVDKELFFSTFTDRTVDWIDEWSNELAELLQVASSNEINRVLKLGIKEGIGIKKIASNLKESYGFSRTRARTIAITEVLTAHSHAGFESGTQNPSVDRFNWKHSGARGIKPRAGHVALGKEPPIAKDELFEVGNELAKYPRDTNLSAKERVNCHCLLQQIADDKILGLSLERRMELQAEAIENDNRIYHKKSKPK